MKIAIKQGIIIGAAVLVFGGLVVQGAWATPNPQPVPVTAPTAQSQTTTSPASNSQNAQSFVNGMINWMQGYFHQGTAKGQVSPHEQQGLNQMYDFMRQYSGVMYNMMGGYGGGMMGGFFKSNRSTQSSL